MAIVSSPFLCLVEEGAFDLFLRLPTRLGCSDYSSLHSEEWVIVSSLDVAVLLNPKPSECVPLLVRKRSRREMAEVRGSSGVGWGAACGSSLGSHGDLKWGLGLSRLHLGRSLYE